MERDLSTRCIATGVANSVVLVWFVHLIDNNESRKKRLFSFEIAVMWLSRRRVFESPTVANTVIRNRYKVSCFFLAFFCRACCCCCCVYYIYETVHQVNLKCVQVVSDSYKVGDYFEADCGQQYRVDCWKNEVLAVNGR